MSAYHAKSSAMKITKGEKTRRRLLDAAVKCFVVKGWEGASVSELARAGQVNRALFNHYFDSKEKLIAECLAHVGLEGRSRTLKHFDEDEKSANSVERYVRATFGVLRDDPHLLAFLYLSIHRATYDEGTRAEIDVQFKRAWDGIVDRMRQEPALAPLANVELARRIHMAVLGGITAALVDPKGQLSLHEERVLETVGKLLV